MTVLLALLTLTTVVEADETFRATLTGDQEVPPVATLTTGRVKIQFNKDLTEGEFTLSVNEGVRVTQSYLHCPAAGVNGPIIVFIAGLHAAGLNVDGKWVSNASFTDTSIVNTACGSTVAAIADAMRGLILAKSVALLCFGRRAHLC